ncbi:hypothetical protein ACWGOE_14000, partial [Leucobacter chromiiresistens]
MKVTISGTRDGQPWPERGQSVDLPDGEAKQMVAAGLAEPHDDSDDGEDGQPPEENTANPGEPEKATGLIAAGGRHLDELHPCADVRL